MESDAGGLFYALKLNQILFRISHDHLDDDSVRCWLDDLGVGLDVRHQLARLLFLRVDYDASALFLLIILNAS